MKTLAQNSKWLAACALAVALGAAVATLAGCGNSGSSTAPAAKQYTCAMHPEVVLDKPGKCPKCGMELVEKK